jgi:hypothetical protein
MWLCCGVVLYGAVVQWVYKLSSALLLSSYVAVHCNALFKAPDAAALSRFQDHVPGFACA